jgi:glycosyltransferase involved in cell wall biosynthesis
MSEDANQNSGPNLSLIIPFFNEEKRIQLLIDGLKDFDRAYSSSYEVILMDDGSTDKSVELIKADPFYKNLNESGKAQIESLPKNGGKGAAIKQGVMISSGKWILTLDADMATSPLEIENWKKLKGGQFKENEIWIGSRPHEKSKLEEKPYRKFVGIVFNAITRFVSGLQIQDTQCGFKLYPGELGRFLFRGLKVKGWAHDVEILKKADLMGVAIEELPVNWTAVDESKVSVVKDSVLMFWQMLRISIGVYLYWVYKLPFKLIRSAPEEKEVELLSRFKAGPNIRSESIARMVFHILFLVLLFLMPFLSKDYGISGDEWIQNEYGKEIYAYFFEGNDDVLYPQNRPQLYDAIIYYTGGYELFCATVYKTFGLEDEYAVRHVINSLFGVLLFVFTGLLAKEITGSWRAALIALVMIVFTPRIFGHAMNNPKDVPFAAGIIFSLYFLVRFVKELPMPRIRDMILLALGIGLTLNIRIGGLLLIAYAGLYSLLRVVELVKNKRMNLGKDLRRLIGYGLMIAGTAYVLGIIFWPFALQDPWNNPMIALDKMTNFPITVSVLFEGLQPKSDHLPWYYGIKWMWISNPLLTFIGLGLFVVLLIPIVKRFGWLGPFMVLFAAVFPPAYAIYQKSVIYDGWRHFLFIWPPVVILASVAWYYLILLFTDKKVIRYGALVAFTILLFLPARWMVMAHPNQYVYFNEIFGGVKNAYGKYETDYYMNSVKSALEKLVESEKLMTRSDTVTILTNCFKELKQYQRVMGFKALVRYSKYEQRIEKDWDYAVFISRFTDYTLLDNNWPQKGLEIQNVSEGGVKLCVVLKKPSHEDFNGYEKLRENDALGALSSFDAYLKVDQANELVFKYRGDALSALGRVDDALISFNEGLKLHPGNMEILQKMGQIFSQQKKPGQALRAYQRIIQYHPEMFQGYYYSGIASLNIGNAQQGIAYLLHSIEVEPRFKQGYLVLSQVYQQQGNQQLAKRYSQMASQLP